MVADAETYRKQDRQIAQYKTARYDLEQYAYGIKNTHGTTDNFIRKKCNEMFSWLSNCCRPTLGQFLQWENDLKQLTLPTKENVPENYQISMKIEKEDMEYQYDLVVAKAGSLNAEKFESDNDFNVAKKVFSLNCNDDNVSENKRVDDDIEMIVLIESDP